MDPLLLATEIKLKDFLERPFISFERMLDLTDLVDEV
jgi:hypothetical protein